jgi:hypothetical protein
MILIERTIENLYDIRIEIVASFIIDLDVKKEDFEILKNLYLKKNLTMPVYNILTPLPGGSLYNDNIDFLKNVPIFTF